MSANSSVLTTPLLLPAFTYPPYGRIPSIVFSILTYVIILCCNLMIVVTIVFNSKLHKPMYLLLVNLPICDMMGASALFPQMISSMVQQHSVVPYWACALQALFGHLYGGGSLLILTAMALDRYAAICSPLSYNTIMSTSNLIKIVTSIWFIDFSVIGTLICLAVRSKICKNVISDILCTNPSLAKLTCDSTHLLVNNYYGLFTIVLFQGVSLVVVLFTYVQILIACLLKRQKDAWSKALQTCGAHVVVFLFLEFNAFIALLSHRIEAAPVFLQQALFLSVMIFPPLLNPLIYGFNVTDLRRSIVAFLRKHISPVM